MAEFQPERPFPLPDPGDPNDPDPFEQRLRALTPRTWGSAALVACNVLVFMAMTLAAESFAPPSREQLLTWGASYAPLTRSGQGWRLVSATFLHLGWIHLLFNMVMLWDVGRLVERLAGTPGFLVVYGLAGGFGCLASVACHPDAVSAGASGAVFGLFGYLLAWLRRNRRTLAPGVRRYYQRGIAVFLGLNLLLGCTCSSIDLAAHAGGFAAGFGCAWLMAQPLSPQGLARRSATALWVGALGAGLGFTVLLALENLLQGS